MRVIVTGSRHWKDRMRIKTALAELRWFLDKEGPITIVHGASPMGGVDAIAEAIAIDFGYGNEPHPPLASPADPAGMTFAERCKRRNQEMADLGADLCLAFPLDDSRGTWDMVRRAKAAGIKVEVIR